MFPLTPDEGFGGMLLLERIEGQPFWSAKFVSQVSFIPCIGARDEAIAIKLSKAYQAGGARKVRSFHRDKILDNSCWIEGNGWWLSTEEPGLK